MRNRVRMPALIFLPPLSEAGQGDFIENLL